MELKQIRALEAVAAAGSLLGASEQLGVGRARLRSRLKALEGELGSKLLLSGPRGVQLTEAGRDFLGRARGLLRDADALVRLTIEAGQSALDELRICLPTGVPPIAVATLLGALRRRYPGLAVRMTTHPDPLSALDSPVDAFVHFGPAPASGRFTTFAFRRFTLRLMAAPAYLDRCGRPACAAALADHSLLLWRLAGPSDGRLGERLVVPGPDGFEWSPWFTSTDCYVVRAAAEAGHGIALLPDALAGASGWPGAPLELVLPEGVHIERSVRVLLPERTAETARSRAVVAVLREVGGLAPSGPDGGGGA